MFHFLEWNYSKTRTRTCMLKLAKIEGWVGSFNSDGEECYVESNTTTSTKRKRQQHEQQKRKLILSIPSNWTEVKSISSNKHFALVEIPRDCLVYHTISKEFEAIQKKIVKIERLENWRLYSAFCLERELMERPNEQTLYHGTLGSVTKMINAHGFDRNFKKMSVYGKGTYFSKDISLSETYADPCKEGFQCMYRCRVLVGETCLGMASDLVPSKLKAQACSEQDRCDSTRCEDGSIIVTYKDNQQYPEYLITFTKI